MGLCLYEMVFITKLPFCYYLMWIMWHVDYVIITLTMIWLCVSASNGPEAKLISQSC